MVIIFETKINTYYNYYTQERIIKEGINIAPGDLEKVLDQHPAVNNVMVRIIMIENSYILRVVLVIIMECHWLLDAFCKDALCIIRQ